MESLPPKYEAPPPYGDNFFQYTLADGTIIRTNRRLNDATRFPTYKSFMEQNISYLHCADEEKTTEERRITLPAIIFPDGKKEWWINGQKTRDDFDEKGIILPAAIFPNGRIERWISNKLCSTYAGKIFPCIEDNGEIEYINNEGRHHSFIINGEIFPAYTKRFKNIIYNFYCKNGAYCSFKNKKGEDLPAKIEFPSLTKEWYDGWERCYLRETKDGTKYYDYIRTKNNINIESFSYWGKSEKEIDSHFDYIFSILEPDIIGKNFVKWSCRQQIEFKRRHSKKHRDVSYDVLWNNGTKQWTHHWNGVYLQMDKDGFKTQYNFNRDLIYKETKDEKIWYFYSNVNNNISLCMVIKCTDSIYSIQKHDNGVVSSDDYFSEDEFFLYPFECGEFAFTFYNNGKKKNTLFQRLYPSKYLYKKLTTFLESYLDVETQYKKCN